MTMPATLDSINLGSNPGPPAMRLPDMTPYFQFPQSPETQRLRPAGQPTRGKRKIGIYGSTNVSPISRRAMRSGVSRSTACKRSIGSRKPSALKRKV